MNKLLNNILKPVIQVILLVLVAVGGGANAQYPYNYLYSGLPSYSTSIVRNFDAHRAVVYYEEGGMGFVSLVNVVTNTVCTVPLDTGYLMNDMFIMNDSVFLCGRYYYSTPNYVGCIATMNLNAFGSGLVHTTYFHPSYWIRMNLKRIKGFEYTNVSGEPRAKLLLVTDIEYACNHSEPFPLSSFWNEYYVDSTSPSMCTENAVLEVSYPFTHLASSQPQTQKVLRIMNPTNHTEIIHDVVVTDNYVAFVGLQTGTSNQITLHICNKSTNMLKSFYTANPPILSDFDNYYTYSLGTSGGTPFYHACALDGDRIAIVTQDEMSTSSNGLIVRTFDLLTHTMINAQELQCYSHPDLKDVAYNPDLQKIIMLYSGTFRSTGIYCDIFCLVDPYNMTATYHLPGITDNVFHNHYNSLDRMKAGYFISTGGKYGFVSDAGNWGVGRRCYYAEDYYINNLRVIGKSTDDYRYDEHLPYPAFDYVDTVGTIINIPSHCVDN